MLIGPRPEAVAEAEAKIKTAEGAVGLLEGPPRLPHHPLADRRGAGQPHLPSRANDRGRDAHRRGGRHPAGPRRRLPTLAIGAGGPRRADRRGSKGVELAADGLGRAGRGRRGRTGGQGRLRRPDRRSPDRQPPGPCPGRQPRGASSPWARPSGVTITVDEHARTCSRSRPRPILDLGEGPDPERGPRRQGGRASPGGRDAARGLGGRHRTPTSRRASR